MKFHCRELADRNSTTVKFHCSEIRWPNYWKVLLRIRAINSLSPSMSQAPFNKAVKRRIVSQEDRKIDWSARGRKHEEGKGLSRHRRYITMTLLIAKFTL